MRRNSMLGILALTTILATGLALSGDATAGSFKVVSTTGLANGGARFAVSSPFNVSSAMEIEVFEFVTNAADSWRCGITQNNTGQDLQVRLIGLTGTVLSSCVTPVNGVCSTPFIALGGGFAFHCTVSSGAGSPVVLGSQYRFFVQR